jgi:flagellin
MESDVGIPKEERSMSVINTNVNSLVGLTNLYKTNFGIRNSLEKLSSGYKINKAADDPSGVAISAVMTGQIGGIRTAINNAEDTINLIQTADGSLIETEAILQRMRDLSVRASNQATLTASDMARLNQEFNSLRSEINRKSLAITYNTIKLFAAAPSAYGTREAQIGPDASTQYQLSITLSIVNATTLSITNDSLTSANGAQSAITKVNSAINKVANQRARLGVQQRRLNHIINDLMAADINISASRSRILDADMAQEISSFTKLQILQQAGTAILAQANAQPQSVLQLLR